MPPKKPKYQKLDALDHMLKRPDMYIGSTKQQYYTDEYIFDSDSELIVKRDSVRYSQGLLRIFVEALSNAIDNVWRSNEADVKCTKIKVDIDKESGLTTIWNDGLSIPIEKDKDTGLYNPTLIFGNLLTSSNYDDDEERLTSGRNGLGIKLTNVFSKEFTVSTFDNTTNKTYTKKWSNNMRDSEKEKINKSRKKDPKNFTQVSWIPDFERFGVKNYGTNMINILFRYVYDAAMITQLPVFLNGKKIHIKNLVEYTKFFKETSDFMHIKHKECEIVLTPSSGSFEHVAFTNGVFNKEGGVHVDSWSESIFRPLMAKFNKPKKPQVNIKDVKKFFRIYINCMLINPEFTSQSKTCLASPTVTTFVQPKNINAIMKWDVTSEIMDIIKGKELLTLKKTEKRKNVFKKIAGFDPANNAGGAKSKDCTLILCEGLSAKTYAVVGIDVGFNKKKGRDWFGIYPLKGKVLNVRNANISSISKNKEITDVVNALGLQYGADYSDDTSFAKLNYGKVMIMTDADNDGIHISSLIINFFHHMFPSLLKRDKSFIVSMQTPIVRIYQKGEDMLFYRQEIFEKYMKQHEKQTQKIKYYKGLGTSSDKEVKETFGKRVIKYITDEKTDYNVDKVFNSKKSDERKQWLEAYDTDYIKFETDDFEEMSISDFINYEHIKFSIDDCGRSIPNIYDGLKESQRKILYSTFMKNLKNSGKSLKVAQLAGFVAEKSNYHHGEVCLFDTITKMAQDFPGSNNIPYFFRDGQFGTRLNGGKDAANARYIFTKLEKLTRILFNQDDDCLLHRVIDDGESVEPVYYMPILPTILINGCSAGIGTGWSCSVPSYNPLDIIENIKFWLNDEYDDKYKELLPWYRGFNGKIKKLSENKYETYGNFKREGKNKVTITELPINMWTDKYKEFLEDLLENKQIKDLKNYSTPTEVKFVITESNDGIKCNKNTLKLKSLIHSSNMVLFSDNNKIIKFKSVKDIIIYFCEKRIDFYKKRKIYQLEIMRNNLKISKNRVKFLEEVIDDKLIIHKRSEEDIYSDMDINGYDKKDDSYDYLLNMNIRSFTLEKIEKLNLDIQELEKNISDLEEKSEKDLWIEDLDNFEKEYKKIYK